MTDPGYRGMLHSLPPLELIEQSCTHLHLRGVVPACAACFEGHFPGQPVVPGVVQLGWVMELIRLHTSIQPVATRIDTLKFHKVIVPDTQLDFTLDIEPEKARAAFRIRSGVDTVHSTGRICFGSFDS